MRNTNLRNNASFVVCVRKCVLFYWFLVPLGKPCISHKTLEFSAYFSLIFKFLCVVLAQFFQNYFFMKDMLNEHEKERENLETSHSFAEFSIETETGRTFTNW